MLSYTFVGIECLEIIPLGVFCPRNMHNSDEPEVALSSRELHSELHN